MNFYFDPHRIQALLENTEALRRALAQPGRRVIVNIDELHKMIAASARACFSAHEHVIAHDPTSPDDATLPRELRRRAPAPARLTGAAQEMAFRELGRNVAGMIALGGEPVDDPAHACLECGQRDVLIVRGFCTTCVEPLDDGMFSGLADQRDPEGTP